MHAILPLAIVSSSPTLPLLSYILAPTFTKLAPTQRINRQLLPTQTLVKELLIYQLTKSRNKLVLKLKVDPNNTEAEYRCSWEVQIEELFKTHLDTVHKKQSRTSGYPTETI